MVGVTCQLLIAMVTDSLLCLKGSFVEAATSVWSHPLRAFKWLAPMIVAFMCFGFQSCMLHLSTMHYVAYHDKHGGVVLHDQGLEFLGFKKVPMKLLDMISSGMFLVFLIGTVCIRDLRLWVKVFFCYSTLFVLKGVLDYVTTLPDSAGWDTCAARLTPPAVHAFKKMSELGTGDLLGELMKMEFRGVVGDHKNIWPVRYCSDMILSGHTFVMLMSLLAVCDLVRRLAMLASPSIATILRVLVAIVASACAAADLYLIVANHFHYTVDVMLAVLCTLLLYTNAGVAIFADWFAVVGDQSSKRVAPEQGMIWIPALCLPLCCFNGYYAVREMEEADVMDRQRKDKSLLFERLLAAANGEVESPERAPLLAPSAQGTSSGAAKGGAAGEVLQAGRQ